MSSVRLITVLAVIWMTPLSVEAWEFAGLFQVADAAANCSRCQYSNPYHLNQCGCSYQTATTLLRALTDCEGRGTLAGTDIAYCFQLNGKYRSSAFGGIFQLDDAEVGTQGCRSANPTTNACNCPFGFQEILFRALADTGNPQASTIMTSIGVCVNVAAAGSSATVGSSFFAGGFQKLDNGVCGVANPITGSCSCPPSAPHESSARVLYSASQGSFVTLCSPIGYPPPIPPSSASTPLQLYVSTTGSDANNGYSVFSPFRTIQHAVDVVAATSVSNAGRNVTVNILPGTYYQPSTLTINGSSCGSLSDATFVTFAALGSPVLISGGVAINAYLHPMHTVDDSTVEWYEAAVASLTQSFVDQLWYQEAANGPSFRIPLMERPTQVYTSLESTTPPITFTIPASEALPSFTDLSSTRVVMYHSWTSTTNALESYDAANHKITLAGSAPDNVYNSASGNRYRVVNLPPTFGANTSQPWSFYFNQTSKVIWLAVPKGTNISTVVITLPILQTVVAVLNSCDNFILEGVTVAHTVSSLEQCMSYGCSGQSGSFLQNAAVEVSNYVTHAFLRNVEIAHTGGYALWIHSTTNGILIEHAHIHDLGAGGVRIGEAASGTISDRSLLASDITVRNSRMYDGGYLVEAGTGVLLQQAASCLIAHNAIHDLLYTAISTGWNWGYAPTSNNNIIVAYNELYNLSKGVLSDMGCIYNLGTSPGTIMDHNVCHDLQSYGYGGWGLYSDEGTSYVSWTNNIVYRTKSAPYHQHYGIHNLVQNNVFAFPEQYLGDLNSNSNGDFAGVRSSPAYSGPEHQTSFELSRNIVLLRNVSATLFYSTIETAFINVTSSSNVYFNTAAATPTLRFPCYEAPSPLDCTFAQWNSLHEDTNSLLANPLFLSAEVYDFTSLSPDSPALTLGFVPINVSTVGPQ